MMAVEGPFVAALIARMPEPALNLAAYGVAFSLAWLVESPIMMLLTAATALVRDRATFLALRRFSTTLNVGVTGLMLLLLVPPVFRGLAVGLMGLPPEVAHRVHVALVILLPWPAAIGYRRFYQGVLVRHRLTRRVAYGTVVRLSTMCLVAVLLALGTRLHGAWIGAAALSFGVVAEAVASRWMALHVVRDLLANPAPSTLTQRQILTFYVPLALTSTIALITGPMLTFFLGRSQAPIASLAVLPVVNGLVFLFRSGGIAYQEVAVALSGPRMEHGREVGRMAARLGTLATLALAAMLFTPLGGVWLRQVSGLGPDLEGLALGAARLLVLLPALEYWMSFQRAPFILGGATRTITLSTVTEVLAIAAVMTLAVVGLGWVGAFAASVALFTGRLSANLYLLSRRGVRPPVESCTKV